MKRLPVEMEVQAGGAPAAKPSPFEIALKAMTQGKALMRRRAIRATAHRYERGVLRAWLGLPECWLQEYAVADRTVTRAVIRRLKRALSRDRRLRGPYLRRTAAPLDRETILWGFLGGELLLLGRHVKRPEDIA
jgi:hypothetical protein